MLKQLTIRNLAIISDINIEFDSGYTVLLGETGAGKSIIIDALSLITRDRASSDLVGKNGNKAIIEGVFLVDEKMREALKEIFGYFDEDLLVINREIDISGRSLIRLNNRIVTLGMIKQFMDKIVDIHSQHENQYLLNPASHLHLIDQYAGEKLRKKFDEYTQAFSALTDLNNKKEEILQASNNNDIELLKEQLDEINKVSLKENEIDDLKEEYRQIAAFEEINSALGNALNNLEGEEESLSGRLYDASKELEKLKQFPRFLELGEKLSDCYYQLEDIIKEVRDFSKNYFYDTERLEEINSRLYQIERLQRKYGENYSKIQDFKKTIEEKIAFVEDFQYQINKIEQEITKAHTVANEKAGELTSIRSDAAKHLSKLIEKEARDLYMENIRFVIDIKEQSLSSSGADKIEFFISLNAGQDPRPLAKIISGGELSRIMLVLKVIFADLYGTRTIIFDEIDNGVSGRVAVAMAEKIKKLAERIQVLVVTHLPQVAAKADNFYLVVKYQDDKVKVTVEDLDLEKRITVIAKMLGSNNESLEAAKLAKELMGICE